MGLLLMEVGKQCVKNMIIFKLNKKQRDYINILLFLIVGALVISLGSYFVTPFLNEIIWGIH